MELNDIIKSRKSIRKFSSKKPDWRDILECIEPIRFAPMAGNIFSLKVILVDDPKKIQVLADAAQQDFIAQAHYVVVFCSDKGKTINSYGERGERYIKQQAGAAIQTFLLKLQEYGLSTCWVGAFADEIIKRELKIPDKVDVEAFFPIGYEHATINARKKVKPDLDVFLYFNSYKNKKMRKPKKLNV